MTPREYNKCLTMADKAAKQISEATQTFSDGIPSADFLAFLDLQARQLAATFAFLREHRIRILNPADEVATTPASNITHIGARRDKRRHA